eukprot:2056715-Pleurochrysis_carterae.AAC.10
MIKLVQLHDRLCVAACVCGCGAPVDESGEGVGGAASRAHEHDARARGVHGLFNLVQRVKTAARHDQHHRHLVERAVRLEYTPAQRRLAAPAASLAAVYQHKVRVVRLEFGRAVGHHAPVHRVAARSRSQILRQLVKPRSVSGSDALATARPASPTTPELVPPVTSMAFEQAAAAARPRQSAASTLGSSCSDAAPPVSSITAEGRGTVRARRAKMQERDGGRRE